MRELKRIRLGNYLIGMRIERLTHSIVFRSLVSHIADTAGVLNKFRNTDKMCMFMDFDDKIDIEEIDMTLDEMPDLYFHLFRTSENHFNAISTTLISKSLLDANMKYYLPLMDYRFVYVYFRDGCNAIRMIPKLVKDKEYRPIKYIRSYGEPDRLQHAGLSLYLQKLFGTPVDGMYCDNSSEQDLIIREYETINW